MTHVRKVPRSKPPLLPITLHYFRIHPFHEYNKYNRQLKGCWKLKDRGKPPARKLKINKSSSKTSSTSDIELQTNHLISSRKKQHNTKVQKTVISINEKGNYIVSQYALLCLTCLDVSSYHEKFLNFNGRYLNFYEKVSKLCILSSRECV